MGQRTKKKKERPTSQSRRRWREAQAMAAAAAAAAETAAADAKVKELKEAKALMVADVERCEAACAKDTMKDSRPLYARARLATQVSLGTTLSVSEHHEAVVVPGDECKANPSCIVRVSLSNGGLELFHHRPQFVATHVVVTRGHPWHIQTSNTDIQSLVLASTVHESTDSHDDRSGVSLPRPR